MAGSASAEKKILTISGYRGIRSAWLVPRGIPGSQGNLLVGGIFSGSEVDPRSESRLSNRPGKKLA
jgi:hypothetical protein